VGLTDKREKGDRTRGLENMESLRGVRSASKDGVSS